MTIHVWEHALNSGVGEVDAVITLIRQGEVSKQTTTRWSLRIGCGLLTCSPRGATTGTGQKWVRLAPPSGFAQSGEDLVCSEIRNTDGKSSQSRTPEEKNIVYNWSKCIGDCGAR